MPRVRLGVVLLVPGPIDLEVDGLRRAFGDPAIGRIAPHITLVPPVNVRDTDVAAGLAVLRAAAGRARPIDLRLGPVRVFPGDEHVGYLEVGGEAASVDALSRLRTEVFRPPLERELDHDFVPHVTVTQGIAGERLDAAVRASGGFEEVDVRFTTIHLLQEQHAESGRRWEPVADVPLGPPVIVGRGGLPVELTAGDLVDPEARSAAAREPITPPAGTRALVVTARREGTVAGLAQGWTAGPVAELDDVWVADPAAGVAEHLRAAWRSAAADRGAA